MTLDDIYKLMDAVIDATPTIENKDIEVSISVNSEDLKSIDRELHDATTPNAPFRHREDVSITFANGLSFRLREK